MISGRERFVPPSTPRTLTQMPIPRKLMVRNPPADGAPAAVQPARRSMLPLLAVAGALLVAGSCSGREVRVERVDREVQLDADGQVVGSTASSTTFVTDTTAGRPTRTTATTTTAKRRTPALTVATAQNGSAAIDCGDGASIVTLSNGAGSLDAADGSTTKVALEGTALLDDLDGDGADDLVAAYRCADGRRQVALSASLWHGPPPAAPTAAKPTRSAVATDPVEGGSTVTLATGANGRQVELSVLESADGPTLRTITAKVDGGRIRIVSDGVAPPEEGAESQPVPEFPASLNLDQKGLGPVALGATEAQLNDALGQVVSRVEYPPVPPCFVGVDRVVRVGPMHFGLANGAVRTIWITGPDLATTERTIPLTLPVGDRPGLPSGTVLKVGDRVSPASLPAGLQQIGFGDGWVALSPRVGGSVSVALEATSPGEPPERVTGFGIAERVCLTTDFTPTSSADEQ